MKRTAVRGPCLIYRLVCPMARCTRYIGKTDYTLTHRANEHMRASRCAKYRETTRAHWIKSLTKRGLAPVALPLFYVPDGDAWQQWERFFIASCFALGFPMVNGTRGGDGMQPTVEARKQRKRERAAKDAAERKSEWAEFVRGLSLSPQQQRRETA